MTTAQRVSASPLLFMGFDLNIPPEDLQETVEAWGEYISRLEQATAGASTKEMVVMARLRRGVASSLLGAWEQAIHDLQQVIDAQPDPMFARTAYGVLGGVYCEQGQDEQAIRCWSILLTELEHASARAAQKLPQEMPLLYLYRGLLSARQERYQQAIADCTRAAEFFPACAEIYAVRGLARACLGEVETGLEDCTQAIKLEPTQASWYQRRGVVQLLRGEERLALGDFQHALALDPEHEQAQRGYLEAKVQLLLHLLKEAERGARREEPGVPLEA